MLKLLLTFFMTGPLWAANEQPKEFHVCVEDKSVFHLYNSPGQEDSSHPGILIDFLKTITQKYGIKLEIVRRPAIACRVLMKAATVQGYGIVSYSEDREEWAVYPKNAAGHVDPSMIFNNAGYYLYSRKDKTLPWDGKRLESLKGMRIGSNEGYSINDELKKAGVKVVTFKSMDAMYTRLMEKQLDGVALHSNRIDKKAPKLGLYKYEVPLKTNDYYFTFSKAFYQEYKSFCEKVWKDSVNFEQSPEGKKAMERYESIVDFPNP